MRDYLHKRERKRILEQHGICLPVRCKPLTLEQVIINRIGDRDLEAENEYKFYLVQKKIAKRI